jgi:hypothetical protein
MRGSSAVMIGGNVGQFRHASDCSEARMRATDFFPSYCRIVLSISRVLPDPRGDGEERAGNGRFDRLERGQSTRAM